MADPVEEAQPDIPGSTAVQDSRQTKEDAVLVNLNNNMELNSNTIQSKDLSKTCRKKASEWCDCKKCIKEEEIQYQKANYDNNVSMEELRNLIVQSIVSCVALFVIQDEPSHSSDSQSANNGDNLAVVEIERLNEKYSPIVTFPDESESNRSETIVGLTEEVEYSGLEVSFSDDDSSSNLFPSDMSLELSEGPTDLDTNGHSAGPEFLLLAAAKSGEDNSDSSGKTFDSISSEVLEVERAEVEGTADMSNFTSDLIPFCQDQILQIANDMDETVLLPFGASPAYIYSVEVLGFYSVWGFSFPDTASGLFTTQLILVTDASRCYYVSYCLRFESETQSITLFSLAIAFSAPSFSLALAVFLVLLVLSIILVNSALSASRSVSSSSPIRHQLPQASERSLATGDYLSISSAADFSCLHTMARASTACSSGAVMKYRAVQAAAHFATLSIQDSRVFEHEVESSLVLGSVALTVTQRRTLITRALGVSDSYSVKCLWQHELERLSLSCSASGSVQVSIVKTIQVACVNGTMATTIFAQNFNISIHSQVNQFEECMFVSCTCALGAIRMPQNLLPLQLKASQHIDYVPKFKEQPKHKISRPQEFGPSLSQKSAALQALSFPRALYKIKEPLVVRMGKGCHIKTNINTPQKSTFQYLLRLIHANSFLQADIPCLPCLCASMPVYPESVQELSALRATEVQTSTVSLQKSVTKVDRVTSAILGCTSHKFESCRTFFQPFTEMVEAYLTSHHNTIMVTGLSAFSQQCCKDGEAVAIQTAEIKFDHPLAYFYISIKKVFHICSIPEQLLWELVEAMAIFLLGSSEMCTRPFDPVLLTSSNKNMTLADLPICHMPSTTFQSYQLDLRHSTCSADEATQPSMIVFLSSGFISWPFKDKMFVIHCDVDFSWYNSHVRMTMSAALHTCAPPQLLSLMNGLLPTDLPGLLPRDLPGLQFAICGPKAAVVVKYPPPTLSVYKPSPSSGQVVTMWEHSRARMKTQVVRATIQVSRTSHTFIANHSPSQQHDSMQPRRYVSEPLEITYHSWRRQKPTYHHRVLAITQRKHSPWNVTQFTQQPTSIAMQSLSGQHNLVSASNTPCFFQSVEYSLSKYQRTLMPTREIFKPEAVLLFGLQNTDRRPPQLVTVDETAISLFSPAKGGQQHVLHKVEPANISHIFFIHKLCHPSCNNRCVTLGSERKEANECDHEVDGRGSVISKTRCSGVLQYESTEQDSKDCESLQQLSYWPDIPESVKDKHLSKSGVDGRSESGNSVRKRQVVRNGFGEEDEQLWSAPEIQEDEQVLRNGVGGIVDYAKSVRKKQFLTRPKNNLWAVSFLFLSFIPGACSGHGTMSFHTDTLQNILLSLLVRILELLADPKYQAFMAALVVIVFMVLFIACMCMGRDRHGTHRQSQEPPDKETKPITVTDLYPESEPSLTFSSPNGTTIIHPLPCRNNHTGKAVQETSCPLPCSSLTPNLGCLCDAAVKGSEPAGYKERKFPVNEDEENNGKNELADQTRKYVAGFHHQAASSDASLVLCGNSVMVLGSQEESHESSCSTPISSASEDVTDVVENLVQSSGYHQSVMVGFQGLQFQSTPVVNINATEDASPREEISNPCISDVDYVVTFNNPLGPGSDN